MRKTCLSSWLNTIKCSFAARSCSVNLHDSEENIIEGILAFKGSQPIRPSHWRN